MTLLSPLLSPQEFPYDLSTLDGWATLIEAYGNKWRKEKGVPLLWENETGDGRVIYLAGRPYDSISSFHRTGAYREALRRVLLPLLRSRPFITDIEFPAEVWLNLQPERGRLVVHFLSFEKQLNDRELSIRGDLIGEEALQTVYPVDQDRVVQGDRRGDHVIFKLPRIQGHMIMTANTPLS